MLDNKDSKLRYVLVHNFPTESVPLIKEERIVDSVDDFKIFGFHSGTHFFSRFRVTRREDCTCPELNHSNSYFKKKVSLEEQKAQKRDRFLRGRQIAYLIYDCFRVTGVFDSVENYGVLFTVAL